MNATCSARHICNHLIELRKGFSHSQALAHFSLKSARKYSSYAVQDGRPFRMAVVGSGPAGFYTAYKVISGIENAAVDMYDHLPVPYGLVRFGVAPDHPEVKVRTYCSVPRVLTYELLLELRNQICRSGFFSAFQIYRKCGNWERHIAFYFETSLRCDIVCVWGFKGPQVGNIGRGTPERHSFSTSFCRLVQRTTRICKLKPKP